MTDPSLDDDLARLAALDNHIEHEMAKRGQEGAGIPTAELDELIAEAERGT